MKDQADPRHLRRQQAVQQLYEWWFYQDNPAQQKKMIQRLKGKNAKLARETINHCPKIDQLIGEAAPEWPLEGIAKVDLSILRLAIYELLFGRTAPVKVIIDEAVELAKELGGESSPSFVNGVLGNIVSIHEP